MQCLAVRHGLTSLLERRAPQAGNRDLCYRGDQAGIVRVSGGGIEFMRPWTERVHGISPEEVVGSSIKTKYEMRDGKPVLVLLGTWPLALMRGM
jgi:hypothetical protein